MPNTLVWSRGKHPQAVADAIAATALDGAYGPICVIGSAVDEGDVPTLHFPTKASAAVATRRRKPEPVRWERMVLVLDPMRLPARPSKVSETTKSEARR